MQFEIDWDENMIEKTIHENPYGVPEHIIDTWKRGARWGWRNICADSVSMCQGCRDHFNIDDDSFYPSRRRWDRHLIMGKLDDRMVDEFLSNCDIGYYQSTGYRTADRLAAKDPNELEREAVRQTWKHIWKWSAIKQEADHNQE